MGRRATQYCRPLTCCGAPPNSRIASTSLKRGAVLLKWRWRAVRFFLLCIRWLFWFPVAVRIAARGMFCA